MLRDQKHDRLGPSLIHLHRQAAEARCLCTGLPTFTSQAPRCPVLVLIFNTDENIFPFPSLESVKKDFLCGTRPGFLASVYFSPQETHTCSDLQAPLSSVRPHSASRGQHPTAAPAQRHCGLSTALRSAWTKLLPGPLPQEGSW